MGEKPENRARGKGGWLRAAVSQFRDRASDVGRGSALRRKSGAASISPLMRLQEKVMRTSLGIAIAGLFFASAVDFAEAQTRGRSGGQQQRTQVPVSTPANPYGLSNCADRPFARDCDRRGTW